MSLDPHELVADFIKVAELAGVNREQIEVSVEELRSPHIEPSLPKGKMAVYVFFYQGKALKVGKAGPKSQARYKSQHYEPGRAGSTLAGYLLENGSKFGIEGLSKENVSEWIKNNTDRINFILDASSGVHVLGLLESFLQCRLRPEFEGFASQR